MGLGCAMRHNIYLGDCLELLEAVPPQSVDMVLCDLPYGVLNKGNPHAQWDRPLPMDKLWAHYRRVCKSNAAIVLFGQGMFTADLMKSNPQMWRYNLVWDKNRATGFLNANRQPLRYHEDILVFYSAPPVYHPQMEDLDGREPNHARGHGKHNETNRCYGDVKWINSTYTDKKFPRSIIKINAIHCGEDQSHATQKPVALLEYLIRTYTNEGDTVLDNCMGTGSTGVACVNTGRNFIGMEIGDEYYSTAFRRITEAEQRVDAEKSQMSLFFGGDGRWLTSTDAHDAAASATRASWISASGTSTTHTETPTP